MPDKPTFDQGGTMLQDATAVFRTIYNASNSASPNYRDKENDQFDNLKGEFAGAIYNATLQAGGDLSSAIGRAKAAALMFVQCFGQILGYQGTDVASLWPRVFKYWHDNTKSIKSRQMTFDTIDAVGSPVGNGSIWRLTKDALNYTIEAVTAETKTFICTKDFNSGSLKGGEEFTVTGEPAELSGTLQDGSGLRGLVRGIGAIDSQQIIANPSFDVDAASASPTQVTGWTPTSSIGNYEIVSGSGNYYRSMHGVTDANSKGLKQDGADTMTGLFTAGLQPGLPYYVQVAVKPSSANGNAVLACGSKSVSLALTALSGWQILKLPLTTDRWFDNFNQATLAITLQWTGSSGSLIWDDLTIAPFQFLDGTWLAPVGGSTRWQRLDTYDCADTEGATALIGWFLRQAGLYLPTKADGSETLDDPTL